MFSTVSVTAVWVTAAPSALLWLSSLHSTTAHACSVFVAPSTLNAHKLGLFAGLAHAPHAPLQVSTQLLMELFDANKNDWSPWMDFFFSGSWLPSLAHDFERDLFLPGIASMVDCFEDDDYAAEDEDKGPLVVNVVATSINDQEENIDNDDSRGDSRKPQQQKRIHRSTHATAGSYTYHSGFTFTTTRSLAAGQEIFPSCRILRAHPTTTPNNNDGTKKDNNDDYHHHHRSIEWLHANAICIDTLDVQPSSIPGIGRGAFAKYDVSIGQPIATTPVIHFDRSQMHRVAQLRVGRGDDSEEEEDDEHHPAVESRSGVEYHADHVVQDQLLLNYCWSHPLSHVLLLPIGMGVQAINHARSNTASSSPQPKTYSPNAYLRWKNLSDVFGKTFQNNHNHMNSMLLLSLTAHQLLERTTQQLWVEVVALKAIEAGDEIFLDYGAEWQNAWDAHEAAWFSALTAEDQSYVSADEYLDEHHHHHHHHRHPRDHRPLPTMTENEAAPLDKKLPPTLQTACFYRAREGLDSHNSSEEEESPSIVHFDSSVHASFSCLFPCSIIERHEERRDAEERSAASASASSSSSTFSNTSAASVLYYYTVQIYNRSGGTLSQEQDCGTMPVNGAQVLNVPAWAVTLVDTPYSIDALVKQAFRHPMGVPQDDFWPASWMTKDPMPLGDFIRSPLAPAEVQLIRWADTGAVVHHNAYRVGFHPHFHHTMMRYCRETGIVDVMRHLTVKGNAIDFDQVAHVILANEAWDVTRAPSRWRSNLHWLSPGNDSAYQHFLQALSVAGFDEILVSIGTTLGLNHLVVFQPTFVTVSYCVKGEIHVDFSDSQNKTLNVIFPIILVNETGPELSIQSDSIEEDEDGNRRVGRYRYELNVGSIVGDDTAHGTSAADYRSNKEMRLVASIYIAEVTEENVDSVISHYNHAFPPDDRNLLLSWAGLHWNATDPNKKLPSPPKDHILLNNANPIPGRLKIFQNSYSDFADADEDGTDADEEEADTDEVEQTLM